MAHTSSILTMNIHYITNLRKQDLVHWRCSRECLAEILFRSYECGTVWNTPTKSRLTSHRLLWIYLETSWNLHRSAQNQEASPTAHNLHRKSNGVQSKSQKNHPSMNSQKNTKKMLLFNVRCCPCSSISVIKGMVTTSQLAAFNKIHCNSGIDKHGTSHFATAMAASSY